MFEKTLWVERAGAEVDAILRNLYEHYVHDMSEWMGLEVRADGSFGYDTTSLWQGDHAVFLARVGNRLAGFGVVGSAEKWLGDARVRDVKDFFVLRRYRRQGVGDALAAHLWNAFPGPWLVRVFAGNAPALSFWRRVVGRYTDGCYQEQAVTDEGRDWIRLRFDSTLVAPLLKDR
jgi:predicted acetyltransferase